MLDPFDYVVCLASFLLEVYIVVCAFYRKDFLRYLSLNLYMLLVAIFNCGLYYCIEKFGFTSRVYFYYYYYLDSLLYIVMYLVIIQLYQQVFLEVKVSRQIRAAAALLLAATALFSYIVVHQNKDHMTARFVVELEQNLSFVGVVLIYLLWGAILKLRETRTRLIQIVLALGIYFSAVAGTYALRNLFPDMWAGGLHWFPALFSLWLPAAWAYTFTRVPEEARLATARLAMGTR